MSTTNDEIQHYQRKIEKYSSDPKVLLHCLNKLTKLPIGVEHLQATGIGRTVNGMRKAEGAVGETAKVLVNRWKEMVAAEDEKSGSEEREEEARNSQDSDASSSHRHKSSKKVKDKESKHKESHKEEASSSRNKSGSSSRSKSPDRHKRADKKSKDSSSKDGESSSKSKSKSKSSRKRRHSQADDSSSQAEDAREEEEAASRSFADALGSIETSGKKNKKSKDKDKDKEKHRSEKRSKTSEPSSSSVVTSPPVPVHPPFPSPGVPAILASLPRTIDIRPSDFEISPHYKPLPLKYVQEQPPVKLKTSEEALSAAMAQKGARTKVFSGNRSFGLSYVPTLFDSCMRVLQNNISTALSYWNTGGGLLRHGIPFDLLRPVLERATAQQLFDLENQNPYLLDDTDVLWHLLCQKDFKKAVPDEMETWRELYLRCHEERERRLKNLTFNHKQSLAKATPVRTTKLAFNDDLGRGRGVGKKGQTQAVLQSMTNAKTGARPFEAAGNHAANGANVAAEVVKMAPPSASRSSTTSSSTSSSSSSAAAKKPKVAPLMQKTLKLMKNRFRR